MSAESNYTPNDISSNIIGTTAPYYSPIIEPIPSYESYVHTANNYWPNNYYGPNLVNHIEPPDLNRFNASAFQNQDGNFIYLHPNEASYVNHFYDEPLALPSATLPIDTANDIPIYTITEPNEVYMLHDYQRDQTWYNATSAFLSSHTTRTNQSTVNNDKRACRYDCRKRDSTNEGYKKNDMEKKLKKYFNRLWEENIETMINAKTIHGKDLNKSKTEEINIEHISSSSMSIKGSHEENSIPCKQNGEKIDSEGHKTIVKHIKKIEINTYKPITESQSREQGSEMQKKYYDTPKPVNIGKTYTKKTEKLSKSNIQLSNEKLRIKYSTNKTVGQLNNKEGTTKKIKIFSKPDGGNIDEQFDKMYSSFETEIENNGNKSSSKGNNRHENINSVTPKNEKIFDEDEPAQINIIKTKRKCESGELNNTETYHKTNRMSENGKEESTSFCIKNTGNKHESKQKFENAGAGINSTENQYYYRTNRTLEKQKEENICFCLKTDNKKEFSQNLENESIKINNTENEQSEFINTDTTHVISEIIENECREIDNTHIKRQNEQNSENIVAGIIKSKSICETNIPNIHIHDNSEYTDDTSYLIENGNKLNILHDGNSNKPKEEFSFTKLENEKPHSEIEFDSDTNNINSTKKVANQPVRTFTPYFQNLQNDGVDHRTTASRKRPRKKTKDATGLLPGKSVDKGKMPRKTKRIKLIIHYTECSNSSDTSDSDNDKHQSTTQDCSFLDDFNVDEIVDSLNTKNSAVSIQTSKSLHNKNIEANLTSANKLKEANTEIPLQKEKSTPNLRSSANIEDFKNDLNGETSANISKYILDNYKGQLPQKDFVETPTQIHQDSKTFNFDTIKGFANENTNFEKVIVISDEELSNSEIINSDVKTNTPGRTCEIDEIYKFLNESYVVQKSKPETKNPKLPHDKEEITEICDTNDSVEVIQIEDDNIMIEISDDEIANTKTVREPNRTLQFTKTENCLGNSIGQVDKTINLEELIERDYSNITPVINKEEKAESSQMCFVDVHSNNDYAKFSLTGLQVLKTTPSNTTVTCNETTHKTKCTESVNNLKLNGISPKDTTTTKMSKQTQVIKTNDANTSESRTTGIDTSDSMFSANSENRKNNDQNKKTKKTESISKSLIKSTDLKKSSKMSSTSIIYHSGKRKSAEVDDSFIKSAKIPKNYVLSTQHNELEINNQDSVNSTNNYKVIKTNTKVSKKENKAKKIDHFVNKYKISLLKKKIDKKYKNIEDRYADSSETVGKQMQAKTNKEDIISPDSSNQTKKSLKRTEVSHIQCDEKLTKRSKYANVNPEIERNKIRRTKINSIIEQEVKTYGTESTKTNTYQCETDTKKTNSDRVKLTPSRKINTSDSKTDTIKIKSFKENRNSCQNANIAGTSKKNVKNKNNDKYTEDPTTKTTRSTNKTFSKDIVTSKTQMNNSNKDYAKMDKTKISDNAEEQKDTKTKGNIEATENVEKYVTDLELNITTADKDTITHIEKTRHDKNNTEKPKSNTKRTVNIHSKETTKSSENANNIEIHQSEFKYLSQIHSKETTKSGENTNNIENPKSDTKQTANIHSKETTKRRGNANNTEKPKSDTKQTVDIHSKKTTNSGANTNNIVKPKSDTKQTVDIHSKGTTKSGENTINIEKAKSGTKQTANIHSKETTKRGENTNNTEKPKSGTKQTVDIHSKKTTKSGANTNNIENPKSATKQTADIHSKETTNSGENAKNIVKPKSDTKQTVDIHSKDTTKIGENTNNIVKPKSDMKQTVNIHSKDTTKIGENTNNIEKPKSDTKQTVDIHSKDTTKIGENINNIVKPRSDTKQTVDIHSKETTNSGENANNIVKPKSETKQTVDIHSKGTTKSGENTNNIGKAKSDTKQTVDIHSKEATNSGENANNIVKPKSDTNQTVDIHSKETTNSGENANNIVKPKSDTKQTVDIHSKDTTKSGENTNNIVKPKSDTTQTVDIHSKETTNSGENLNNIEIPKSDTKQTVDIHSKETTKSGENTNNIKKSKSDTKQTVNIHSKETTKSGENTNNIKKPKLDTKQTVDIHSKDATKGSENTIPNSQKNIDMQSDINKSQHIDKKENKGSIKNGSDIADERIPLQVNYLQKLEDQMFRHFGRRFTLGNILNEGHFSNIYMCKDTQNNNYVLKILHEKFSAAAVSKDQMPLELQNKIDGDSHIRSINSSFNVNGSWCLMMDYYPKTLEQALVENGRCFHINLVQILSRQLIAAVRAMTMNGIIHSDINPRHILLNCTNAAMKLCGFDRSSYASEFMVQPTTSHVNYRAPEVILGFEADYRIDVWAAALVMFEMATNRKLFPATHNNDLLFQHLCTLGSISHAMKAMSKYSNAYFRGTSLIRRRTNNPQEFSLVHEIKRNSILRDTLFRSYHNAWGKRMSSWQVTQDMDKLESLHGLLENMLVLDPRHRLPITFAAASDFIHDLSA